MLYELEPSVEVTGGPWFTENELDTGFIETLTGQTWRFIQAKSFPRHVAGMDALYSTSYAGYATAADVCAFVKQSRMVTVELSMEDVQVLLDVLVYDGRVEEVRLEEDIQVRYRALRDKVGVSGLGVSGTQSVAKSVGVGDVPCGQCPVARSCAAVGPIRPDNCVYLAKWLEL